MVRSPTPDIESGTIRVEPWAEVVLHSVVRTLQFVLGLAVIGLYGDDLAREDKPAGYEESKWV